MNRNQLLALAVDYAVTPPDSAALDRYLSDVLDECARYSEPPHVAASLEQITAGDSEYTPPAECVRILHAFYSSKHLSPTNTQELEAYSDYWRTDAGDPWAINFDEQSGGDFQLYPIPSASSASLIPAYGEPFGRDYPSDWCVLIYGSSRAVDIHDYTALPLALRTLAREFSRPSSHRDKTFSDGCLALSDLIFSLIGVTP